MRYTPEADRLIEKELEKARRRYAELDRLIPQMRDEKDKVGRLIGELETILYPMQTVEKAN